MTGLVYLVTFLLRCGAPECRIQEERPVVPPEPPPSVAPALPPVATSPGAGLPAVRCLTSHTVQISIQRSDEGPQFDAVEATGILLDRDEGVVVTTSTDLESARRVIIRFSGTPELAPRRAEVLGIDAATNVGLVRIGRLDLDLPSPPCGDPQIGRMVLTLCARDQGSTAPGMGLLQGRVRNWRSGDLLYPEVLAVWLENHEAEPGGVVAHDNGQIVGIFLTGPGSGEPGGVRMALPMPMVQAAVHRVLAGQGVPAIPAKAAVRPWLGIGASELEDSLFRHHFSLEGGVVVLDVVQDSPAMAAGLECMDVLVGWNGAPIRDMAEFGEYMLQARPGSEVELAVVHRGLRVERRVTLASW